jgi:UDP-2,3-diacylglucosamine pyrophosphatase LpxH
MNKTSLHSIKLGSNVIETTCKSGQEFLLLSDIHFDNPKCKRDKLKKVLSEGIRRGAKIAINGDFFCLMQGKYDPRRSKKDILPQHNVVNYLDAVIDEAVEWWKPYAEHLVFIGYGNHETAIIKNVETDPLGRFVEALNTKCKTNILTGAYGGWWILRVFAGASAQHLFKVKYYHGTGGGGVVTKGVIQNNRMQVSTSGADCIWMGHVHELYHHIDSVDTVKLINGKWQTTIADIHHVRTGTFKEEFGEGAFGFHVERGAPPKPIGCMSMVLNVRKQPEEKEFDCRRIKPIFTILT